MTPKWKTPQELIDMFDALLGESQTHHSDTQSDETLVQCLVCGEWEGHTMDCPMPVIETWMGKPEIDIRDIAPEPLKDMDGTFYHAPEPEITIKFRRIPSEPQGYIVWLQWGRGSAFLVGTVRPSRKQWQATFDDGRKPNVKTGDTMAFATRQRAAEWLKQTAEPIFIDPARVTPTGPFHVTGIQPKPEDK